MLIDNLDVVPEIFTYGARGLMLIRRNKDGEEGNAQRRSIKRITHSRKQWMDAVLELRDLQHTTHQGYRIYSSVNERDMQKAIHEFRRRQLETEYGNQYEHHCFYTDIENRFFSCLMNPNCRATNYFLIDCDTDEEFYKAHETIPPELFLFTYPTKNGNHIITRPFNPNDYGNIQIKKDEVMYIG